MQSNIETVPPASTKLQASLWHAFCRGNKRQFARGVSGLGAVEAANLILAKLMAEANPTSLLNRSRHLFLTGVLRSVKRSEDFFPTLLRGVIYRRESNTQLQMLDALSWRIKAEDLVLVHPCSISLKVALKLAYPLSREHVSRPISKSLLEDWVDIVVHGQDHDLLDAFRWTLSDEQWVGVWERIIWNRSAAEVDFLLKQGLSPTSVDDQLHILCQVLFNDVDQQDVLGLLLTAWQEAASRMDLSTIIQTAFDYWENGSFRLLLSAAKAVTREDWSSIFCWDNVTILGNQIDAFAESTTFAGWDTRSHQGENFLIEADARLSNSPLAGRLAIISKLLEGGADPDPLLQHPVASTLPQEEVALLREASEERKKRKQALVPPPENGAIETTLELI